MFGSRHIKTPECTIEFLTVSTETISRKRPPRPQNSIGHLESELGFSCWRRYIESTGLEFFKMNDSISSKYSNRLCLPLLTEWVVALVFYFGAITMSITGSISLIAGSVTVCLSCFAFFNSMHAAAHRHFSGGIKKYRWIDESIGRITGVLTQIPYRPFAKMHMAHH